MTQSDQSKKIPASVKDPVTPCCEKHNRPLLYGAIGFLIALFILIAGFWPTVLLVLFAAIGVAIGRYRDGDQTLKTYLEQLIKQLR